MAFRKNRLNEKFEQQYPDPIQERHRKNTLGRAVLPGIDIIGEQGDVAHQAPHAQEGDELLGLDHRLHEFTELVFGETDEVDQGGYQHRAEQSEYDSKLDVIPY